MITDKSRLRRAAEHEAAHAVVADALGMAVGEVRINDDGTGQTEFRSGTRIANGAVAAAGTLWIANYRWQQYPGQADLGCEHDMRALAACGDDVDRREARRRAAEILSQRGDDVLDFAEFLVAARRADWNEYLRGVDAIKSGVARAIGERGLDAVRAARLDGTLPSMIGAAGRGPEPQPGWQRAAYYPNAERRSRIGGDFGAQQDAHRNAWFARQQRQEATA